MNGSLVAAGAAARRAGCCNAAESPVESTNTAARMTDTRRALHISRPPSSATQRAANVDPALFELSVCRLFESPQRADGAVVVERQQLHHVHGADLLDRIDPELGVEDAGPAHASRAAEALRCRIVRRDLKPEPELVLAGPERKRLGALLVRVGLQLDEDRAHRVLPHLLDRRGAEDSGPAERAVVEQHANELRIVLGRGVEAAVAA